MMLENVPSLRNILDDSAVKFIGSPFIKYLKDGEVVVKNFEQFRSDVLCVCRMIRSKFLDRTHVAIISKNRYEYFVCLTAVIISGSIAVPCDPDLSAEEASEIFTDADVSVIFYGSEFEDRIDKTIELSHEIEYILDIGDEIEMEAIYRKFAVDTYYEKFSDYERDPNDCALIIYTSGTTGDKKGVMLSQYALMSNLMYTPYSDIVNERGDNLVVLPMHHIFCIVSGFFGPLRLGSCLCLNGEMRDLFKNLLLFKPAQMRLVPLIAQGILARVRAVKAKNPELTLKEAAAQVTGGNLKMLLSGGAYLEPSLCDAFDEMGIFLRQGYGMSEVSSKVTVPDFDCSTHSVGRLMNILDARVQDGEIQIKTPSVMLGYYKKPKATEEVFTSDGYLRTGDIGYITEDRQLFITGRLKNLIILSNGENVSPEEIENKYKANALVKEVLVFAEDNAIAARIYPDKDYASANGIEDIKAALEELTDKINEKAVLSHTVAKVIVSDEPLEKTALGKIKRNIH